MSEQFHWLTDEFSLNLVKKICKKNNVNIESVKVESALPKGENFASNISRIEIQYIDETNKSKKLSVIQKSVTNETMISDHVEFDTTVDDFYAFTFGNEIETYLKIFPEIEHKFSAAGLGENYVISPK